MKREHMYLQIKTVPTIGMWSRLPESRLGELTRLLDDGWELVETVKVDGSFGFTAHVIFVLGREAR